jgi:hypothetical protein
VAQTGPKGRFKMNTNYAETLATNLKSFLGKDTFKVVCPCIKCMVVLPITIDELAQKLQADGVEYDDYKAYGKWCHKYIQANA